MKIKTSFSLLFALAVALLPSLAFAFEWKSDPGDKSIFFLGQIFGVMGNVLPEGTGGTLVGDLFRIFNIAVLSLGAIVVSYTIIMTTINTAQEGEVMGRKWSSLWIPMRSAVGMAFLIPSLSGYSLIQLFMMDIVMHSIHAANQVWSLVASEFSGKTSGFSGSVSISKKDLKHASESLLESMICTKVINTDEECQVAVGGLKVVSYTVGDQYILGIPTHRGYKTVCGGLEVPPKPKQALSDSTWIASNLSAYGNAASSLQVPVNEIYSTADPLGWTGRDVIFSAMNTLRSGIISTPQIPPETNDSEDKAAEYGWLYAGSYYFSLVTSGNDFKYPAPELLDGKYTELGSRCEKKVWDYIARADDYLKTSEVSGYAEGPQSSMFSGNKKIKGVAALVDAITSPIRALVYEFLDYLTENQEDPISSLRKVGSDLMMFCEISWVLVMVTSLYLLLGSCAMSGSMALCWITGAAILIIVPLFTLIVILLWPVGALLGIYVPLIPYIVYTFTALGWFLLVIESMVAAPVVALGLVSPGQEALGRASPAVQLITNIFLRPSLMVIGFIAAAKLAEAVIDMVNFGFKSTIEASVTGLGLFGLVALLTVYGGLALAVIHECFTLIHILPDKITRWIGGHAEQSSVNVKQQLGDVQKSTEKGAEIGGGLMKASTDKLADVTKKVSGPAGIAGIAM